MKRPAVNFLWVLLLSIILFVAGIFIYEPLFMFFEPNVEGVKLQVVQMGILAGSMLLFSLVLALIPVLLFWTWKLGAIVSFTGRALTVLIVLAFIAIGIWIRHVSVRSYFTQLAKDMHLTAASPLAYPVDPVNFVIYIAVGLCAGCLVAYFSFRQKR
jgi:hypothetical protein